MAKISLAGFVRATSALPAPRRTPRGGAMFMKLAPSGITVSAGLKNNAPDKVDVLINPKDPSRIALVEGNEFEIGKNGNTWTLKQSATLARQLEDAGWDRSLRNLAEMADDAIIVTNEAIKGASETPKQTRRRRSSASSEQAEEAA